MSFLSRFKQCIIPKPITPFQKTCCVVAGLGITGTSIYAGIKTIGAVKPYIEKGTGSILDAYDRAHERYQLRYAEQKKNAVPEPPSLEKNLTRKKSEWLNKQLGNLDNFFDVIVSSKPAHATAVGTFGLLGLSSICGGSLVGWYAYLNLVHFRSKVIVERECCNIIRATMAQCAITPLLCCVSAFCFVATYSFFDKLEDAQRMYRRS